LEQYIVNWEHKWEKGRLSRLATWRIHEMTSPGGEKHIFDPMPHEGGTSFALCIV
jgi:hypothetical protein